MKEGTEVGNFLPNITQYITLNETDEDLKSKWRLITSLLRNAFNIVFEKRDKENEPSLWGFLKNGLAFVGGIFLVGELFFSSDDD